MKRITTALMLCVLNACGATNTGNPNEPGGSDDAPKGVHVFRSKLERESPPSLSSSDRAQLGVDSRELALALYGQAVAQESGNVAISPYSISVALAMAFAGANAETKSEMADALHFTLSEPDLHAAWNAVDQELAGREDELLEGNADVDQPEQKGKGLQLDITNATFVQSGFEPKQPFLDTLAVNYGAGLYAADFQGDPKAASMAINDWVKGRTNDRIVDLLTPESLEDARLVLLNAIYFKASWLTPFEAADTKPGTFHTPERDVSVDMMHGAANLYAEGDGYQAVALPYLSPAVSMIFIVPDAGTFEDFEASFDRSFFDSVQTAIANPQVSYAVDLALPKFKIHGASVSLVAALKALGMQLAFDEDKADFSRIADPPPALYISDVLHQTFLALDEKGTEAAAATAVIVSTPSSAPPPPKQVQLTIDRPCLFAIYDQPTEQILFIGRLIDPS